MWFIWIGCTEPPDDGPDPACPEVCEVALRLDATPGAVIVRSDPPGFSFEGDVLDGDGAAVAHIGGLSEQAVEVALVAGGAYVADLTYACAPGASEPPCRAVRIPFVAAGPTTTTTSGTPDGTVTDVIVQEVAPSADLLFVVDDSCSMTDQQNDLIGSFPVFVDSLVGSGVDYHIGVVTTDLDRPGESGKLRAVGGQKWIDDATVDPTGVFDAMASVGTTGSGQEQGLGAVYTALELERDGYNAGFLRDASDVHVIVLSDEDDQTRSTLITEPEFEGWFDGLRGSAAERSFSSIVALTGPDRGDRYLAVTEAIGGAAYDITAGDYAAALLELGLAAAGLHREFPLSAIPDPDTLDVTVVLEEGTILEFDRDVDYVYDATRVSVVFQGYVPESGAQVVIRYVPAVRR
ncbi:MAG: hypothetical protein ABMB14_39950 [Myxococcota bacterium]